MTNSQSDIEELKNMQREATEQRAKRKRLRPKANKDGGAQSSSRRVQNRKPSTADEDQTSEAHSGNVNSTEDDQACDVQSQEEEAALHDLSSQIETMVKNMEETAKERPALTLMAAFSLGIIVGQLFSRR